MTSLDTIERTATDLVARVAPWLSPLPTAYLIGRATVVHLGWPDAVGVVAAVIVECLGLATTVTALDLREYNATRRKSDPAAPFLLAAVLVGAYLGTAIILTVALDTMPTLATFAPALFPGLSLAGMMVLALRHDQARRVATITAEKRQAYEERQARQQKRQVPVMPEIIAAPEEHGGNGDRPRLTYAEFCRAYPEVTDLTGVRVAALTGTSERTGRLWLARRKADAT